MLSSDMVIHEAVRRIEEARASRPFKYFIVVLVLAMLAVIYNYRVYKNFNTQEAMDAAQLGRNLAEGRGYTTLFVRPFSMYLIKERNQVKLGKPAPGQAMNYSQIRTNHPDISNPPLYPVALAGLMKTLPFRYEVDTTNTFWSIMHPGAAKRIFWRYQPDFLITMFNEVLFLLVIAAVFIWARRLFDAGVAWVSAFILFSSELLWRFSVSGLSTLLLLLIFMGLVWCLTLLESELRAPKWKSWSPYALAAAAGVAAGLGGLTRYSFLWMIVPTVAFVALLGGPRRVQCSLIAVTAFALVVSPWVIRNYNLSGTPFGTATYSVMDNTLLFPQNRLERSLEPTDVGINLRLAQAKLFANSREILQDLLFNLGGGWITGFFLVGLLVQYRSAALRQLRLFLVAGIVLMILVQALARTHLSADSPVVNSENLLVVFLPLVVVFGVGLFFILLDQLVLPAPVFRYAIMALFTALMCLPMIFVLLLPKSVPVTFPPYSPQHIQLIARWMKETELIMSDVPWAVAWYGKRQSVWLTQYVAPDALSPQARESFFAINDYQKPVNALYLSPLTLDAKFNSAWLQSGEHGWGHFILGSLVKNEVPSAFPLRQTIRGFLPDQIFLSDWKRWQDE